MRSEEKKGRHMQVKKGRVLGLVIVGPLRSLGVGVSVVFFIFLGILFIFFPFYIYPYLWEFFLQFFCSKIFELSKKVFCNAAFAFF